MGHVSAVPYAAFMPVRDLQSTQLFFATRADGWEGRFPDDDPFFAKAVEALQLSPGDFALDAGCGTGRALPFMRSAVGASGHVAGFDATPEMISEATKLGRLDSAALFVGDVLNCSLPKGRCNGILAAGLLPHLPDPSMALLEFARIAAPDARLALFHPISREALCGRHGDDPDKSVIAPAIFTDLLTDLPWELESLDDGDQYLAVVRRSA